MLKKRSRIESFSSRPSGEKTRTGTNFKPTGSGLLPEKDEDGELKEEEAEDFLGFSKDLERLCDLLDQQACYDSHVKLIKEAEEDLGIKPSQIIVTVEGDKYSHTTGEEYIKMYSED